jgi:hypothetical protein
MDYAGFLIRLRKWQRNIIVSDFIFFADLHIRPAIMIMINLKKILDF